MTRCVVQAPIFAPVEGMELTCVNLRCFCGNDGHGATRDAYIYRKTLSRSDRRLALLAKGTNYGIGGGLGIDQDLPQLGTSRRPPRERRARGFPAPAGSQIPARRADRALLGKSTPARAALFGAFAKRELASIFQKEKKT